MRPSTHTSEGDPYQCPVCGKAFVIEPSIPSGDAPCPHCDLLVWFPRALDVAWSAGFPVFSINGVEARNKVQAVRAVVGRLIEAGYLRKADCDGVISAILKRELLGSTAIGRGLALPHAIHGGVEQVVGALARFPGGVDFDASDGHPVYLLCLLVAPIDRPSDHLRALEAVSRSLRSQLSSCLGPGRILRST